MSKLEPIIELTFERKPVHDAIVASILELIASAIVFTESAANEYNDEETAQAISLLGMLTVKAGIKQGYLVQVDPSFKLWEEEFEN